MLHIGMLWYDDSAEPLAEKLARAAAHYQRKHGRAPNICYVHPSYLGNGGALGGIHLVAARSILPHHFWLGVADSFVEPHADRAA